MERKINEKIEKLEGYESVLDNFENKTIEEFISTNYENSHFQTGHIKVTNSRTGEPIEGATIQLYDDSWYYYYDKDFTTYTYTTNSNGLSERTEIRKGRFYYFNVSAPGY
jgi:Prealbumin-like fold domain